MAEILHFNRHDIVDDGELSDRDQLKYETLAEWRHDDRNFLGWRWDSATAEEYYDGNQFTQQDRAAMAAAGVPMIPNNRIASNVNDIIGLQASQLTDWIVRSENVGSEDMVSALGARLKTTERLTKTNSACLKAFASQVKAGIGWLEIGRERDPFRYPYYCKMRPWREMWWDWRSSESDLSDANYVRREKWFRKEVLQARFKDKAEAIEYATSGDDESRQLIEPQQYLRNYEGMSWRDPPITWNMTVQMMEDMRALSEIWYQVQCEGKVVRLPTGRVMLYEDAERSPMAMLALRTNMAEIEDAAFPRWRQAFWIGDVKIQDRWSPYPFQGPPFIPFWGYRESMTGVPYGLIRAMIPLQDTVNTLEGKILFSMSAVRVKVKKGATDVNELRRTVGDKRAVIEIEENMEMADVQIDEHIQLNDQHIRVLDGSMASLNAISGTQGLNPASQSSGKPRSAAQAQAQRLMAMAALGEIQDNYQDARTIAGTKLLDLEADDISRKGNVPIQVRQTNGVKKTVVLNQHMGQHMGHQLINNDLSLLHRQVVLDDVPHTATYRAQQFEKISEVLSTMPPEAVDVRRIVLPEMIEVSDLPHAEEIAQKAREAAGLAPPTDPAEIQKMQQQQQDQEQQKQIATESALAQIGHKKAQAEELQSRARLNNSQAAAAETEGQSAAEQDAALIDREKKVTQIAQVRAKTAKTIAETSNALQPQNGIAQRW